MAIGSPKRAQTGGGRSAANVGVRPDHQTVVADGSWRSDWVVCYDDATTACTSGDEIDLSAIDNSQFHWIEVPEGATLVQFRARTPVDAETVNASPVGEIWALDSNGVPQRLDQDDHDSATQVTLTVEISQQGVTIDGVGAVTEDSDDGYYYTDVSKPSGSQGYDLNGNTWVGFVVLTAADVVDGEAAAEVVEVLCRFLNA